MSNTLEFGSTAVGAPGSIARDNAERCDRYAEFWRVYAEELKRAVTERPQEYGWPVEQVPVVVSRMVAAFDRGSYNHDSTAFRWTCNRLKIKHTRKAIREFIDTGARK